MKLKVLPLTPQRWPDLEAVFRSKGCSVARGCWCMYYRRSGAQPSSGAISRAEANRRQLRALVQAGEIPGLVGYRDGSPVGWVSLGPRESYAKLQRSPVMKPVDARSVWSVVCFVVPSQHRGQGVARALLDGAIAFARKSGVRLLEAYPVDKHGRQNDDSLWFGTQPMFEDAGFREVARRKPTRSVMRIDLSGRRS